jgi:hypothetical protein
VPATSLHAGYRYDDYLFCRRQDRQIQGAILLGANQFLAVEQQHRLFPGVFKPQFWHRAAGAILSGSQYNGIVLPGSGYPASAAGRAYGASVPGTSALFHNLPLSLVKSYKNAFAPRLGVAYNVANKTVIRAGGGVFHQRQMANQNSLFTNPPNQMVVTVNNGSIDNPGSSSLNYPLDFRAAALNFKYPTAYSYSLSVQHELPRAMVLDVAYVGKTAVNQERVNGLNAAAPGTVQAHPNQSISAFRPYLGLGNINWTTHDGRTSYNALQVTLDKRLTKGLGVGMAYTFSKNLSNLMNQLGTQQAYNPQGFVKGPDELDRTHVINVNFIYDLPFWQNGKGTAQKLVGGWHLSGVFVARSGAPLSVTTTVDNAGVGPGLGPQPWNLVGDPTVSGSRGVGLDWFNPAVFTKPNPGTFGNAGLGIIKGPGYWNLDLAPFKDFRVSERVTAQFRWEVYDAPNYAFLANPGTDPTSTATFGIITSKGGTGVAGSSSAASASQRDMQIALKFRF